MVSLQLIDPRLWTSLVLLRWHRLSVHLVYQRVVQTYRLLIAFDSAT